MTELNESEIAVLIRKVMRLADSGDMVQAASTAALVEGSAIRSNSLLESYAHMHFRLGQHAKASDILRDLLADEPENERYSLLLAKCEWQAGHGAVAEQLLRERVNARSDNPEVYFVLGSYLYSIGACRDAADMLQQAVSMKPGNAEPYPDLVLALRQLGEHDQALKYAKKLIRLRENEESLVLLAGTLIEMGEVDAAREQLKKAVRKNPRSGLAWYNLSNVTSFSDCSDAAVRKMESVLESNMSAHNKSLIRFALGKAYDDCGDYSRAFEHYRAANLLVKAASEPVAQQEYFKRCKKAFSGKVLRAQSRQPSDVEPVFIIGMPRSGTTLLETVLARHSECAAAGELMTMTRLVQQYLDAQRTSAQSAASANRADDIEQMRQQYLHELQSVAGADGSKKIIDKMPGNFLNLGMIHLLFPQATVINIYRHPLDTVLSCYFQSFSGVEMSFDLEWAANYYHFYRTVLAHWKSVLPPDRVIDVHYEDLVSHSEQIVWPLLQKMGLQWEEACVSQQPSERKSIITASYTQARKGIYTSSKYRWKNYAGFLELPARKLHKYLDQEDVDCLQAAGVQLKPAWRRLFGS